MNYFLNVVETFIKCLLPSYHCTKLWRWHQATLSLKLYKTVQKSQALEKYEIIMTIFTQILPFAIKILLYWSYNTGQLRLQTQASGLTSRMLYDIFILPITIFHRVFLLSNTILRAASNSRLFCNEFKWHIKYYLGCWYNRSKEK